ncbi:AAA family ATPase [Bartonella raoultii]|uniref:MoxR family ATPase n=1 Tax=Bartonella raoultii TaxID=1457020 RepID=A0ABS7I6A3_9HYPH|nr:MoxR family ATPase [Bartonella raoultii]MBX4335112.1 MoxR family ATPase [Bartonella raoultii]
MSQSNTSSNSVKKAHINDEAQEIIHDIDTAHKELDILQQEIDKVIFGQNHVIEYALIAIFAGGHALLVGAPGLAKTRLVETLGTVLGLDEKRIQFTPDLMPSDVIGSEIMDSDKEGKRSFRYIKGPIFTQLLMADEINRASPRTQSALLQAMQEYHVTVAGTRYDLPQPFHVLATQNPFEQEGTYPLPEAQLDRFLMQIDIDYPDLSTERRIILETTKEKQQNAKPILSASKLQKIQQIIRKMPLSENIVEAILKIVRSARPHTKNSLAQTYVAWGPGPRASQALSLCVRARALYYGRLAPSLDDVEALAYPVLQHRMALNFSARAEDITIKDVINNLVKDAL